MTRSALLLATALSAVPISTAYGQGEPTNPWPGEAQQTQPPTAHQDPDEAAAQQYERAQQLYHAHRYADALPMFRQLAAEQRSPNARLYVARCLRQMGRLPEAYDEMDRTWREATARAVAEPRFAQTRDAARAELTDLDSRLVRIVLNVPTRPRGLVVHVNGEVVREERFGRVLAVMPGQVQLLAEAPGHTPARQQLVRAAGTFETVTLTLKPVLGRVWARGAHGSPRPPDQASSDGGVSGVLVGGFVALGVGLIGAGMFVIAGASAEALFDEIDEKCEGQRCDNPAINDNIDEGRTMDTVANVGLGVGLTGLLAAGVLFTVELTTDDDGAEAATSSADRSGVRVSVNPVDGWLGVTGTF